MMIVLEMSRLAVDVQEVLESLRDPNRNNPKVVYIRDHELLQRVLASLTEEEIQNLRVVKMDYPGAKVSDKLETISGESARRITSEQGLHLIREIKP